jgi:nitrogen fixation-related uncharacterized protein
MKELFLLLFFISLFLGVIIGSILIWREKRELKLSDKDLDK